MLSRNAQDEGASAITRDNVPVIADAPGIRKAADGKPIVSADALTYVAVTKRPMDSTPTWMYAGWALKAWRCVRRSG